MRLLCGTKTECMSVTEMRAAGENAASCLGAFGGYGIPTDAHNAIVDLGYLLEESLHRVEICKRQLDNAVRLRHVRRDL